MTTKRQSAGVSATAWLWEHLTSISGESLLATPFLISPNAKNLFCFLLTKYLFFFCRKIEKLLTHSSPLFFFWNFVRRRGLVSWTSLDGSFCSCSRQKKKMYFFQNCFLNWGFYFESRGWKYDSECYCSCQIPTRRFKTSLLQFSFFIFFLHCIYIYNCIYVRFHI